MLKDEEVKLLEFMSITNVGIKKVKTQMNQNGCEITITKSNGVRKKYQMSKDECLEFAEVMSNKEN